jgi:hypothetical protein
MSGKEEIQHKPRKAWFYFWLVTSVPLHHKPRGSCGFNFGLFHQTPGVFKMGRKKSNMNPGGLGFNFGLLRQSPGVFMSGRKKSNTNPGGLGFNFVLPSSCLPRCSQKGVVRPFEADRAFRPMTGQQAGFIG